MKSLSDLMSENTQLRAENAMMRQALEQLRDLVNEAISREDVIHPVQLVSVNTILKPGYSDAWLREEKAKIWEEAVTMLDSGFKGWIGDWNQRLQNCRAAMSTYASALRQSVGGMGN